MISLIIVLVVATLFLFGFGIGIQIERINILEKRVDRLESEVDTE
jgi:hypothetical protein